MIIRHFDVKTPATQPPQDEGWEQTWAGYYVMTKCMGQQIRTELEERFQGIRAAGEITETEFGQDCFLSILADIKREHVNMFELGAGWGRICLNLAGIIDNSLIPLTPVGYRCLAVEGEPIHYQWVKEHFETQSIKATVVHGAVSDKNGTSRFSVGFNPDSCYGQAMTPLISSRKLPSIGSLLGILKRRSIRVSTYTIDHLIQAYGFDHVDIIHADVQGAEYKAILGANESIKKDLIDYIFIETHDRELNDRLSRLLSPKFDLIVNIYPRSLAKVDGFAPIRCHDGIQIYKRKNI